MAKYNISFNNTNYSVDEAALSTATAELRTHLSTTMSGSGAVINLGGTAYNVDSAKLSTATNDFISHLGKISGSGHKVTVGGVEYGVDSTKLTSAISDIEAVLTGTGEERLEGDGAEFYTMAPTALSFRSTAPLNELQEIQINGVTVDPSNYTLEEGSTIVTFPIEYLKTLNVGSYEVAVASDSKTVKGDFSVKAPELNEHGFYYNTPYVFSMDGYAEIMFFVMYEDGRAILTGYDTENNNITSNSNFNWQINNNNLVLVDPDGNILSNISIVEDGASIVVTEMGGSTFQINNSTMAADNDYFYVYNDSLGGYIPIVVDQYKTAYAQVLDGINNKQTVALVYTFEYCTELVSAPSIPTSVTSIGKRAFYSCQDMQNVIIGSNVNHIGDSAFENCSKLTEIVFEGTMEQWNAITKGSNWNTNVPATYVQCSDGQAAL